MRLRRVVVLVALGLGVWLGVPGLALLGAPALAWASRTAAVNERQLEVGTELVALREVTLRDATIAKGSRVKIVEIARTDGRPVAVSLELKDGYVLRGVAYRVVQQSFRLAQPSER